MEKAPEILEIGQWFNDRSHQIWHYFDVPPGMRRARLYDLYIGRQVLYQVQIGPHKGDYYTAFYVGNAVEPLREKVKSGVPVYVKG